MDDHFMVPGPAGLKAMNYRMISSHPEILRGVRSFCHKPASGDLMTSMCFINERLHGRIVIGLATNSADANPKDQGGHQMFRR